MNSELQLLSEEQQQAVSQVFNRPLVDMGAVMRFPQTEQPTIPLGTQLSVIKINSVAFRDRRDIRKSLSQFYGVLHAVNCRFMFIMECREGVVDLYLALDNTGNTRSDAQIDTDELTHSLLGILPGCQVKAQSPQSVTDLLQRLCNQKESYLVTGVPTCQLNWEKREQHQEEEKARTGIERIVDSLAGEDFILSILCEPLPLAELQEFRTNVAELYNMVKPLGKFSVNQGATFGHGTSNGTSDTINLTFTTNDAEQHSVTKQGGTQTVRMKDGNIKQRMRNWCGTLLEGGQVAEFSQTKQLKDTETNGGTHSKGINIGNTHGTTKTESINESRSLGINREQVSMELSAVATQLERLHKRLLQAGGEGMWKTCIMFHAQKESTLRRAAYAGSAIWSGDDSAIDPIRCLSLVKPSDATYRSQFDLLELNFTAGGAPLHPFGRAYSNLYTCLTHKELAHIADMPHWELPGITVLPLVEYARTSPPMKSGVPVVELGGLIDRTVNRAEHTSGMVQKVRLGYDQLNKHCFVSGVTGSGKSTTMRTLLRSIALHKEQPLPFMVIEPVKTEYRELGNTEGIALRVFSPGRNREGQDKAALNPFSFPKEIGLFSHLDFLKSAFNALLGAYSSMPFLLEELLCKAYEKKGWDLATGQNEQLKASLEISASINPEASWQLREQYMPLLGDLPGMVDEVLTDCFGEDKSDYRISLRGALKARLKSLCNSAKGEFLNRHDNYNFADLLKENVVFELEAFSDNDEKAFIMALLLGRLYEHRQAEYQRGEVPPNRLRHIVVLEEAHRLLAKSGGKGETQGNPRGKAVETFSDMLAEVRSYGQGMIIVDQIPSKLTPEVMKNTEVKIVHRLLAKDDREAVGATMNLQKEQIEDLARHAPGEATMYFGNMTNAMHIKISEQ